MPKILSTNKKCGKCGKVLYSVSENGPKLWKTQKLQFSRIKTMWIIL